MDDKIPEALILALMAIIMVAALFGLLYQINQRKLVLNFIIKPIFSTRSDESLTFISEKLTAVFLIGLIPFVIIFPVLGLPPSRIGFTAGQTLKYWYLILSLILLVVVISYFLSKTSIIRQISPELRIRNWFPRHILLSVSLWTIYIFFYELLFRGILLFMCSEAFGYAAAVIINLILYSLAHFHKGRNVMLGTIPIGFVFCFVSYLTGSFFAAFLIHFSMNLVTDIFTTFLNPADNLKSIEQPR
jgi:membrane protease YdiL (CAAX protease family)